MVYVYVCVHDCPGPIVSSISDISVDNFNIEVDTFNLKMHLYYTLDRWMYNSQMVSEGGVRCACLYEYMYVCIHIHR